MGEVEKPSETPKAPVRRRQFSLRAMFLLMAACAFLLGFYLSFYPYSAKTLPCLWAYPVLELLRVVARLADIGRQWRPREAVLATLGLYVVATLVAPAYVVPPEDWRRNWCTDNLHQIGLALQHYHGARRSFPPAYLADEKGRPMHSWRVLILPMIDQDLLYAQYRFDEPWNGPNNSKLAAKMPRVYRCPSDKRGSVFTSYVAVTGPGTMWDGVKTTKLDDIQDGPAQTIAVVEITNSGICWMEPRDLDIHTMQMVVNPPDGIGICSKHREASWRRRLVGANILLADGSLRLLPTNTPSETLRAMLTIAGGETIDPGELDNR